MIFDFNFPWTVNLFDNSLQFTSYQIFILIGLLISYYVLQLANRRKKIMNPQNLDMFYGLTIVIIFVFASLFTLLANITIYPFIEVVNNFQKYSGISSFGGILGLIGSVIIFTKSKFRIADFKILINPVIITGLLVLGIGRLGCFSSGCCYGEICNSNFAVIYHRVFYAPTDISLIPIQLYESLFVISVSIFGLFLYFKKGKDIWIYLIFLYLAFRFCAEFFRGEQIHQVKIFWRLNIYQIIILFAFVAGFVFNFKKLNFITFGKENI